MQFIRILFVLGTLLLLAACSTSVPYAAYKGLSDQQIYQRAEHSLTRGRYSSAVTDFEALDTLYPFGPYSQQAQLDIVYAYYKKGDFDSALAAVDRYIRLYPGGPGVDYAYYMKGLINMGAPDTWVDRWARSDPAQRDTTNMTQALQDFSLLVERYPNSSYVPEARQHMVYIRDLLARHQLQIAQYYLRYHAYVAAANRGIMVVRDYPGTPQAATALAVMVTAYRGLGENTMADRSLQSLLQDYPSSIEAQYYGKKHKFPSSVAS